MKRTKEIPNKTNWTFWIVSILVVAGLIFLASTQKEENKITILKNTAQTTGENPTVLTFFYLDNCPHCHVEIDFLVEEIIPNYPNVKIEPYEISTPEGRAAYLKAAQNNPKLDPNRPATPVTIVGDETIIGFGGSQTTGIKIIEMIENAQN
ncbi:MAG: hypothetical protein ACOCXG_02645 [Nanoarchaeota archaeon]